MIVYPAGLDVIEVDALQTDRYLDALLSAVERRAYDVPADPAVDPTLRLAARRLRDEVVRTHPSFRFEERLARRLADAAARMRLAAAAGGEAEAAIVPFPTPLLADPSLAAELANPELAVLLGARHAAVASGDAARGPSLAAAAGASASVTLPPFRPVVARPLLVGGALAGAAFVAWRLTRGAPADPLAVAVRAARAAREAAVAAATRATAISTAATTAGDAALGHRRLA